MHFILNLIDRQDLPPPVALWLPLQVQGYRVKYELMVSYDELNELHVHVLEAGAPAVEHDRDLLPPLLPADQTQIFKHFMRILGDFMVLFIFHV